MRPDAPTPDYAAPTTPSRKTARTRDGSPGQGVFVRAAILVAALLVIGMVALLYYQWVVSREPHSELIVVGSPQFEGAVITVSGAELDKPYQTTLSAEHAHQAPFFLNRGVYQIHVEHRGQEVYNGRFGLEAKTRATLKLAELPTTRDGATTGPAGTPLPPRSVPRP